MSKKLKTLRIRQLDERLRPFREIQNIAPPHLGWIRELRGALKMTAEQLGRRLGMTQPAVSQLEENEADGTVTLNTLRKAARGLGGELVYAIVPRASLNQMLDAQIRSIARERLARAAHTMRLENQGVEETASTRQFEELVEELTEDPPHNLWA
jgi:predicted DNA-binding mobile mystery protein A